MSEYSCGCRLTGTIHCEQDSTGHRVWCEHEIEYCALHKAALLLLAASQAALSYLEDPNARDDMSDAGFIRYDDVVDALRAAIAAARPGEGPGEC